MGGQVSHGDRRGVDLLGAQVRLLTPDDWRELRAVRMRSLAEADDSLLAENEDEWLEHDWRRSLERSCWVVMHLSGAAIGIARSSPEDNRPWRQDIESLWVAPQFRRLGVGRRLVVWLIDRELRTGIRDIRLWVLETNVGARRLYEKLGFRWTGERQPVGDRSGRMEERWRFFSHPDSQLTAAD